MNNSEFLEKIIADIESELERSGSCSYITKESTEIATDVGYVYDWFEEYKGILRKRYKE